MVSIECRSLSKNEIIPVLFADFDRYQNVTQCWRKEAGKWVVKPIAFVEQWGEKEYQLLTDCLRGTLDAGGAVLGAFQKGKLVGFCSVENTPFGSSGQYLQLSSLHVSHGKRGYGIGRQLFVLACESARNRGAQKLYISSHSAVETQAFYRAMGCVEAAEYNQKLADAEPCDCQLEYEL